MTACRCAAVALALGGCLIVRTHEEAIEDPCPASEPELLAEASGPFVLADAIYFIGANGTLSRLPLDGGPVSELTTEPVRARQMAADATDMYWIDDFTIVQRPLAGGAPTVIADGYPDLTVLAVDDTSIVWASSSGLDRFRKADQTIEHLDDADQIFGLGAWDGAYYYSDTRGEAVRRAPPVQDLIVAHSPGPLVVNESGVYFYDVAEPFAEFGGEIRLVPHEGGAAVRTVRDQPLAVALAADGTDLMFATAREAEYRIKQVSRFGGEVHTLACGRLETQIQIYLAAAPPFVYYVDGRGLYRIAKRFD